MRQRIYRYLRNRSIHFRVYRINLTFIIVSMLLIAAVFCYFYWTNSVEAFRSREQTSLNAYADGITNELHNLDNTVISISQDKQTQDFLLNYASMGAYERFCAEDAMTKSIVDRLHMFEYVTDVVLMDAGYRTIQVYRGPHGDFSIGDFDYRGMARYSLSASMNTVLVNPLDYASSRHEVNRDGIIYLKRINDTENIYFNSGYILIYIDKERLFALDGTEEHRHSFILDVGRCIIYDPVYTDGAGEADIVARVSRGIGDSETGFILSGLWGRRRVDICTCSRIPVLNWYIVSAYDYFSIISGIVGAFGVTIVVILLMAFLQAAVSRSIADSLDRPLQQILAALRRIETGDFTVEEIDGFKDELYTVQDSLNYTIKLLDRLFVRTRETERQKYRLQLQALHAQMDPHFLMNALNSVILLADIQGADNIKSFCRSLSRLMQDKLRSDEFEAPLSKELALLRDYELIMKYRYLDRFSVEYDIRVSENTRIARSVLQPLLENALQHGMEEHTAMLNVRIGIVEKDNALLLTVEDDGCGIPEDVLSRLLPKDDVAREELKKGSSIGLRNIQQRLRLSYGAAYGINIESRPGEYTRVTVRLPKKEGNDVQHTGRG